MSAIVLCGAVGAVLVPLSLAPHSSRGFSSLPALGLVALAPRVAVSSGLLRGASPGELRAVLEHERYHVYNLDPYAGAFPAAPHSPVPDWCRTCS